MENLKIEEKAKRYDEILVKLQKAKVDNNVCDERYCCVIDDIVPEIKESKDEIIKKKLKHFLEVKRCCTNNDEEYRDCNQFLAWLEKQGDKASYESAEKEKQEFVDAGFIKCYADFQDFKEGKTYWLEYLGNDNYNVRSDNLLGKTYHITPCQLYTIFKKQPWTEAQDELTPNPYSGVGFNDNGNVWGMCARDNGVDILCNKKLIQQISAEIKRDKIEPKFKEGDKVLADGKVYTIKRVNEATYIVDENGRDVQEHFSRTKDWKLYEQNSWKPSQEEMDTLYGLAYITHVIDDKKDVVLTRLYQDLKREFFGGASYENMFPSSHIDDEKQDGQKPVYTPSFHVDDFIANEYCTGKVVELTNDAYLLDNGQSIPFSCHSTHLWSIKDAKDGDVLVTDFEEDNMIVMYHSRCTKDTINVHCCLDNKLICSHLGLFDVEDVKPATKTQRDLLFQKLKEAGYKWDTVKKELKKKTEQKPVCTPQFDVDDFIVNDCCMGKVVELTNDAYLLDNGQSIPFSCHSTHLWTIKDANDGDILHSVGFHSDCVFIFNGLDNWKFDEPDGERAVATGYCCLFASSNMMEFGVQGPDCVEVNTIKPASKIQSDLLFQKMKESGYEWDATKKVLKKIEQKAAWSEEDEELFIISLDNLIELNDRYGEEYGRVGECIRWFKSIKDRVQPQPKQEWSREDKNNIEQAIYVCHQHGYICVENWLKSLKDRYTWMPSKENNVEKS